MSLILDIFVDRSAGDESFSTWRPAFLRQIRRRSWLHWDFSVLWRGWLHMFLLERPIELRISPVRVDGEEISHVLLLCFYVYRLQPCYNLYAGGETHRGRRTRVRPTSRPSTRREGLARCKTFTFTTSIFIRVYCTLSAVIRVPAAHTLAVREFK